MLDVSGSSGMNDLNRKSWKSGSSLDCEGGYRPMRGLENVDEVLRCTSFVSNKTMGNVNAYFTRS
jgi:hypothetical protein